MTVSFASSTYSVVGGFASGTLSSATTNTFTVGSALSTMKSRSIWITSGTGVGQRRNILTDGSATSFTVDQAWTTIPDNTSTYLISHKIDDLYAVSTAGLTKTITTNSGGNLDKDKRSSWLLSNKIVVGDSSTLTYFKLDLVSIVCSVEVSSTVFAIDITTNAVFQWGDYDPVSGVVYNSGSWIQAYYEPAGSAFESYIWRTAASSTSELNFYGVHFHGLENELTDNFNAYYAWEARSNSIINLLYCHFKTLIIHRILTSTVNFTGSFFSGYIGVSGGATVSDISVLTPSKVFEANSAEIYALQRVKSRSFNPTNYDGYGEYSATAGAIVNLIDPDWQQKVCKDGGGTAFTSSAKLQEFYTYKATCKDLSNAAVSSVGALIYPLAGTDTVTFNGISNGSGFLSITTQVGLWDSTSTYDSSNVIYNPVRRNLFFGLRLRKYGCIFLEKSLVFGTPIVENPTVLTNPAVTLSSGTAAGYSVTVTDHGASPVTWNGKSFSITIDAGNTLTYKQLYHAIQYNLSQVNTTWNGKLGGLWHELLQYDAVSYKTVAGQYFSGGTLVTKGVRVINALSGDGSPSTMQADDGTTLNFYSLTLTGFPNGSQVKISQSGILKDLVNNQNPPYTYITAAGVSSNVYNIVVSATGYKTYTNTVTIDQNITLPISLSLATSTQTVDSNLVEFSILMGADTAFLRAISEAEGIAALKDEAALLKTWKWPTADYKTAWNAVVQHASVTDPSSGEIAAWTGYLSQTGYTAISFNASTGVVS